MSSQQNLPRQQISSIVVNLLAMIKEVDASTISLDMELYRQDSDQPLDDPSSVNGTSNLGLDSLDALELTLALENQFRLGIPEEIDYAQFHYVVDVVDFIERLVGGRRAER